MSNRKKRWLIVTLVVTLMILSSLACDWDIETSVEDTLLGGTCEDGFHETYTENPNDGMATECVENE